MALRSVLYTKAVTVGLSVLLVYQDICFVSDKTEESMKCLVLVPAVNSTHSRNQRRSRVRASDVWQLGQGKTATPIFTPEDGFTWKIAKACFEASDFM